MSSIKYAQNASEIAQCWGPVKELRPHLQQELFVDQIKEMQQEGYHLLYITAATAEGEKVAAIAGYRNIQMLFCGKIIYIDDLGTLPEFRGKGYAGQLLDYIHQLARETGKTGVHLDSGYQRNDAHRLYLNKGYKLGAHHFVNIF
jgi:GNAT superfamily N-acetyltransferase